MTARKWEGATSCISGRPRKPAGFPRAPAASAGTRRAHTCHQHACARRAPAATTVAAASDPPYFRSRALRPDRDRVRGRVELARRLALLARPERGLLLAAERGVEVDARGGLVDADHPRLQA